MISGMQLIADGKSRPRPELFMFSEDDSMEELQEVNDFVESFGGRLVIYTYYFDALTRRTDAAASMAVRFKAAGLEFFNVALPLSYDNLIPGSSHFSATGAEFIAARLADYVRGMHAR